MYTLKRRVPFYETDGMKVVHHANYLRWMEEARIEYLLSLIHISEPTRH